MQGTNQEQLTVFGQMVESLLRERGREDVSRLPVSSAIQRRMWKKGYPVNDLSVFADLLGLSEPEKMRLAVAYVYDA